MSISITEKRRIALAYDGTEDARKLFEWTIKNILRPESDHLILLSALSRNSRPTSPDPVSDETKELGARERFQDVSVQLRKLKISSEEHILWGDAKSRLPHYTQSNKVDLLVMGSRGLGAVKSVFLGSVSDICLKECPCPVLVVRHTTI